MRPRDFSDALRASRVLVLDAATGTELARRGADVKPPLWSARAIRGAPETLRAIHRDNVLAGADVLTAATFRTHARTLQAAGLPRWQAAALTREAVALAREASAKVLVAGSVGPLEDCWRPDLVPDDRALAREHFLHAEALAEAGVDLALIETMGCVREAVAACRAASAENLRCVVSFTLDTDGNLLSGEPVESALHALLSLPRPPAAVGINCVPARRLGAALVALAEKLPHEVPLVAYGNTGLPLDEAAGLFSEPITPDDYAVCAAEWIARGARLVGGCCGTTAAHVVALRELADARRRS
jgi:S-methylmethionine-dependent homocysteine/selenocysteine methylase